MREILFRGKQIDNGEWVYGSFCMDALEQKNGLCGVDGFIRLYDFATGKMQMHEVDRETVGQYTGLTDKNGKKIFEGDILKAIAGNHVGEPIVAKVVPNLNDYELMLDIEYSFELEIIGNIHDNPELLEEGRQ